MKTEIMTAGFITDETLKRLRACEKGRNLFNELFPNGAVLLDAMKGLIEKNESKYALWLLCKSRLMPFRFKYDEEFKICRGCLFSFSINASFFDPENVCDNEKCMGLDGISNLIDWVKNV